MKLKRGIAVIGAGPAGLLTVAKLLDERVRPDRILWVDPHFEAGRLGNRYRTVESNDQVWEWRAVLGRYRCLERYACRLDGMDEMANECLSVIADILTEATRDLCQLPIQKLRDEVVRLDYGRTKDKRAEWTLFFRKNRKQKVGHVVLATGSHPKGGQLEYDVCAGNRVCARRIIDLDYALNIHALKQLVRPTDCVVIVGSGQSAVLLMKHLREMGVSDITNVFRYSLEQTIASLRGGTKRWALEHLPNIREIRRVHESQIGSVQCSTLIYAIGYERNALPESNIALNADDPDGVLGPCIYGAGIAFPDTHREEGKTMKRVGLTSFCHTLNRRFSLWSL